jgi:iron(III) transport system substrate-binding protein
LRSRPTLLAAVPAAVALALIAGCGGSGSGSGSGGSAKAAGTVSAPILNTLTGSAKTQTAQLIAQAQQEGELDWLATVVSTSKDPLIAEFKKEYGLPKLTVNFENQETSNVTSRIQSEVTARRVTTDLVAVDGAPTFFASLKQAGALLDYTSPELSAYQGSQKYLSDDFGYWVSPDALMYLPVYNPKDWPSGVPSWYDLLNPKLKGKLSFPGVPTSASAVYTYYGLRKVLPLSYFKNLQKIAAPRVGVGNGSTAAQMAAQGELTVAITASHNVAEVSKKLGVPMDVAFPKEGSVTIGWSFGILAGSPHPAAAKLFEDFMLSKAAQQILIKHEYLTPARDDISVPADLAKYAPPTLRAAHAIPLNSAVPQNTLTQYRSEFESVFK